MFQLPPYQLYLLTFTASLVVSLIALPQIISMAGKKQLFDLPDNNRKLHSHNTSNLGGIAIFFAYIIVTSLTVQPETFTKWHYIVAASLLFFLTGMMDDLIALSPVKKLVAQLIPALIITCMADIRIMSLPGIGEISYVASSSLTILVYLFVINAYNLIDGIDWLAGAMGVVYTFILGCALAAAGNIGAACIAFSLMGATAGFLRYNITPARIFMGDTGSLLLGFTITVLCILFTNSYSEAETSNAYIHSAQGALLISIAILSVPVFDCIRVFFLRMRKGLSPFHADRRHAHHYLVDMGLTHLQAVAILVTANIVFVVVAYAVQDLQFTLAAGVLVALAIVFFTLLYAARKKAALR